MNEQTETMEQPMGQPVKVNDVRGVAPHPEARTSTLISPQAGCATCGGTGGAAESSPNGTGMQIGRASCRERVCYPV